LDVRPNGSRLWRYRYRIDGRENMFAVGMYPDVSLADARRARDAARQLVRQGIHPSHQRKAEGQRRIAEAVNTFEAVADEWIEQRRPSWSEGYAKQVETVLGADVYPRIGAKPIREVTAADLLAICRNVEGRGAVNVALFIRQWVSAVFRYATATLRADGDPAAALRGAIHRGRVKHHRPLAREEISPFLATLSTYGGNDTTRHALRLLLLTFVRPGELRAATWGEFDLDAARWTIPGERMKGKQAHIVPLSPQAVAELKALQKITGKRGFLFPNQRRPRECMSATTLNRALENMKYTGKGTIGFSAHGFRATFSTLANELGFRPDVIERQLAHQERNSVRRAYNRAEYLPEREALMRSWADLLDALAAPGGDKVIPGRFGRAA